MSTPTNLTELAAQFSTTEVKAGIFAIAGALLVVGATIYGALKIVGMVNPRRG